MLKSYDYLLNQLRTGATTDDLVKELAKAEDAYNKEKAAEAKAKAKEKVQKELAERAATDVFNAYKKYYDIISEGKELPKDAEQLFNAELKFINYLMEKNVSFTKNSNLNDLYDSLFGYIFS